MTKGPFKQMGSSPAKEINIEEEPSADWWESSPGVDKTDLTRKERSIRKKTMKEAGTYKGSDLQKRTKAKRKEKMSEIGKALVDTGTAISRSDLAGGRGGIIDNYDQIQKEKKSKALEDKSQSILNTYRELNNRQTMKDFDEALVEKNKTSASESHVANSDMNTTIPKNQTAAEKYKNVDYGTNKYTGEKYLTIEELYAQSKKNQ